MRYLFLLNPTAGKRDCTTGLTPAIHAAAGRAGIPPEKLQVVVTQYAGHARALAAEAARTAEAEGEPVRIWTAGGDGTFNEALTGANGCALAAVGCLPFGSGNDFLRTYGTREEFSDLDAQFAGGAVDIDLMETDLGLSATICAAGLDAQVAYGIPQFRRIPFCGGEMAYALSIVRQLCGHIGRKVAFTIDGEELTVDCLMCAVCNGRTYGGGFYAAPEARPDDGWLDVFIIRRVGRLTIARLLGMYKGGKHFRDGAADRAGEALLPLPPGQVRLPAPCGWARPHRGDGGRRVRPLRGHHRPAAGRWRGASCCQSPPTSGSWLSVPAYKRKDCEAPCRGRFFAVIKY